VLMQCKGLMEIVVVTVLYQKGVFGQATFSALVLVALISTAMTVPLCRLCERAFGDAATRARVREAAGVPVEATHVAPAAGSEKVPLTVLVFEDDLGTIAMAKPEVVIGRHSADDIRINDVRVSRHHARLQDFGGRLEIHNQTAVRSEPNPILINGVEREHAVLSDGDQVSLGGVVFTVRRAA
jgi:hypothetical protein